MRYLVVLRHVALNQSNSVTNSVVYVDYHQGRNVHESRVSPAITLKNEK
jgi:hypothetical protein